MTSPEALADEQPDAPALVGADGSVVARGAWEGTASRLAHGLAQRGGVGPGSIVASAFARPRAEAFVLSLALAKLGAGELVLPPALRGPDAAALLDQAGVRALLADDLALAHARAGREPLVVAVPGGEVAFAGATIAPASGGIDDAGAIDPPIGGGSLPRRGMVGLSRVLATAADGRLASGRFPPARSLVAVPAVDGWRLLERPAPSPAELPALGAQLGSLLSGLRIAPGDVHLHLTHPSDPLGGLLAQATLAGGGRVVLADPDDPAAVLAAIDDHGVETMAMEVLALTRLLDDPAFEEHGLATLRTLAITGTTPVSAALRSRAEAALGEAPAAVLATPGHGPLALLPPGAPEQPDGGCGHPLDGVELTVAADGALLATAPTAARAIGAHAPDRATGLRARLLDDGAIALLP